MRVGSKFVIYVSATSAEMAYVKAKQILHRGRKPDGGVCLDRVGIALVCPYIDFLVKEEDLIGEDTNITPLSVVTVGNESLNVSALKISNAVNRKIVKILESEDKFRVTRCVYGGIEGISMYQYAQITADNAPTDSNYDVKDNYEITYAEDVPLSEALRVFRRVSKNLREKKLMVASDYTLKIVYRKDINLRAGSFTWRQIEPRVSNDNIIIMPQKAYILIGSYIKKEG